MIKLGMNLSKTLVLINFPVVKHFPELRPGEMKSDWNKYYKTQNSPYKINFMNVLLKRQTNTRLKNQENFLKKKDCRRNKNGRAMDTRVEK